MLDFLFSHASRRDAMYGVRSDNGHSMWSLPLTASAWLYFESVGRRGHPIQPDAMHGVPTTTCIIKTPRPPHKFIHLLILDDLQPHCGKPSEMAFNPANSPRGAAYSGIITAAYHPAAYHHSRVSSQPQSGVLAPLGAP